jgi:FAD/FMN-containing dehydrogenase
LSDPLLAECRALVGAAYVLTESADVDPFLTDWMGRFHHPHADRVWVVKPANTAEVAAVVKLCHEHNLPVIPIGGNTGLVGGSASGQTLQFVPRVVMVSLGRLNQLRHLDIANNSAVVGAGMILQNLQELADSNDRLFPLSLGSQGSCTVGGNISTNAGGVHVLRYGNMRDLILGLEVVMPDGTVVNLLRGLRKDNTGYNLTQLFAAAEGTLGIITAATVKLFAKPKQQMVAWLAVKSPSDAVTLLRHLQAELGDRVMAYELMGSNIVDLVAQLNPKLKGPLSAPADWQILLELSESSHHVNLVELAEAVLANCMEMGLVQDAVLAQNAAQTAQFWLIRESMAEAQKILQMKMRHDISIPVSAIAHFIDTMPARLQAQFPGLAIICFGHLGDGNLHYNAFHPDAAQNLIYAAQYEAIGRLVYDFVAELNGSISAEHGVGQVKRDLLPLYKSAAELEVMKAIKRALDPKNLMNRDKLIQI